MTILNRSFRHRRLLFVLVPLVLAILLLFTACGSALSSSTPAPGLPGDLPAGPGGPGAPGSQENPDFPGGPGKPDDPNDPNDPGNAGGTDETTAVHDTSPRDIPDVEVVPSGSEKSGVTTIVASGMSAVIQGEGATVDQDAITMNTPGDYELSGSWNGRVIIAVGETDKVKLTLRGFSASCSYDSVIHVASADKVTLILAEGSLNEIHDTDTRAETESDTRGKGAIYARASLEITGEGSLTVSSSYKHGIACTKKLTLSGGTLTVTAADHGLKGNNSVVVEGGILSVNAGGDAIKTEGEDKEDKGFVYIYAGQLTLNAKGDGIHATREIMISGGTLDITTTGNDTQNSTGGMGGWGGPGGGGPGGGGPGGGGPGGGGTRPGQSGNSGSTGSTTADDESAKGIKVGCDEVGTAALLTVSGGIITVNSTGHALHSTGNVVIEKKADLTLTSSQKGIQGHGDVMISGGVIRVLRSTEGIESKGDMLISGGSITVYATDDGINIGGSGKTLTISGGTVDITTSNGDTDGIDSNGSIVVNGGFVLVKGGASAGGMAGSVDTERSLTVNGGTVVALGGICETPASGSSCLTVRLSNKSFTAGEYTVTDSDGKLILSFTVDSSSNTAFRSGWLSSDVFVRGESYTLWRDGNRVAAWTQSSATVSGS